jgi:hypothetical protein
MAFILPVQKIRLHQSTFRKDILMETQGRRNFCNVANSMFHDTLNNPFQLQSLMHALPFTGHCAEYSLPPTPIFSRRILNRKKNLKIVSGQAIITLKIYSHFILVTNISIKIMDIAQRCVFHLKHIVSESGFCLQTVSIQLGPINRRHGLS